MYKKRYSITKYLLLLFFSSSIGAYIVGRQHSWFIDDVVIVLYTSVLLMILFYSYDKYSDLSKLNISDVNNIRLIKSERYLTIACSITLLIEMYVLYKVMGLLLIGMTNVDEFKSGDGTEQTYIYDSVISHAYLTICHFLSPLGYIMLSLHFYYLINNNRKKASKYLFLSLVLVFHGLIGLSRSATVIFILTYVCIFYFVMPVLNTATKRRYLTRFGIVLCAVMTLLLLISNTRFSEYYTKNSKNEALLDEHANPVLFSLIDYFVMWNENGIEFIKKRPEGLMYYGWYNTAGLPMMIDYKVFGNSKIYEQREKEVNNVLDKHVGSLWYEFHGCIARLNYEWGYWGTIIFVILFFVFMRYFSPQKGVLSFRDLLSIPFLLPMGLTFWCGIGIGDLTVQMGMVYNVLFYYCISNKHKKHRVLEPATLNMKSIDK